MCKIRSKENILIDQYPIMTDYTMRNKRYDLFFWKKKSNRCICTDGIENDDDDDDGKTSSIFCGSSTACLF